MKLVVENKRYDEALSMIKNYLDKQSNDKLLNDNLNVFIILNRVSDVSAEGEDSEHYITEEYGSALSGNDVAVQLTLEMWNEYIKHLKNNIKFIKNSIAKDEEYLSTAEQMNRKYQRINKRRRNIEKSKKQLEPYVEIEKVTGKITKKIANSEYEVILENFNETKHSGGLQMAVLIFKNVDGENYYFKCSGGYYGSPYCEGELYKGLPHCLTKQ